ncbi:RNA-binding cell elongation regulator Jag/EloR [Lentilactobacillus sp. Marseille-Q4993]|uniref:RNA-binding cell elongation regulator Jag/EloR n=1 Tax=Lentilactobacillus sp. Marseille-Q4993 TaxID=3039492 RepID=UPI0024BC8B01|nr:RNA-binding cell elongation regulator Jag/EloR [Lentilactobacillus sp. Marseille-Q4993]
MTTYSGNTIEEAVNKGLLDLSLTKENVDIKVITQPKSGFLGFGKRQAEVEITPHKPANPVSENNSEPEYQREEEPTDSNSDEDETKLSPQEISNELESYLTDVLSGMGFEFKLEPNLQNHHSLSINIVTAEDKQSILIGRHGRTINALQGLAQIYVNRLGANNLTIEIDAADYRARRSEALVQLAEKTARNAIANGKPVYLNPMPSFERKQIHNALADNNHVMTYSTGRDPHRVIVVAPK